MKHPIPLVGTRANGLLIASLVLLLIVLAGIRFSDGSVLLAIAQGATVDHPLFKDSATRYIWDSPMKIWLLQILPGQIIPIALAFALLAILPLAGLLAKDPPMYWLTLTAIFLTPAFKVSIQNIGVGDGLIVVAIILASSTRSYYLKAIAFLVIGLWHPQQSFFIGLSYLVSRYCYSAGLTRSELFAVLGSLSAAAAIFFLFKYSLNFTYGGREAFIVERLGGFFYRNLTFAPIAFAPLIAWFLLIRPEPARSGWLMMTWMLILASVSLLTLDVTRVMTIISLPMVLIGTNRLLGGESVKSGNFLICAALLAFIPTYSWSGLDYFLWNDLLGDLCKWGKICL